jgi:hypothetical protein
MKTSALLSYLQRKCRDWDRVALRELLNEIQNMVFMSPNNYMRVFDESTGTDPVLTTIPGQLVYTLDEATFGWDVQFIQDIRGLDSVGHESEYGTRIDYEAPQFRTFQGNENTCAKVIFATDPNGTEYDIECYRRPQELTSENIQLEVPSAYHINNIAKGVIGKVEEADHGDSNTWLTFEKDLLPEIISALNTEVHSQSYKVRETDY